ncbi:MAG: cell envelope integrity protein CreD, partial [Verrucomicrobiae bacterium]|nr:cell envelope integrity protein CreD [Verrucomicrobiae bacterium]
MNAVNSGGGEPTAGGEFQTGVAMKLVIVGCLVLLGLVPLTMIRSVLGERQMRHREAMENITSTWGSSQTIAGPILVIPYYRNVKVWKERQPGNQKDPIDPPEKTIARAYFLPEELMIGGDLKTERLHRSIYEAVVFRSSLEISGHFAPPSLAHLKVADGDILWNEAALLMSITDLRGATQTLWVKWGDQKIPLVPGGALQSIGPVVQARVPIVPGESNSLSFRLPITVNGSVNLRFAPFGLQNRVHLNSTFPDPSFQGAFLPAHRIVTADGFEADWEVSCYGRAYPQYWTDENPDPLGGDAFRKSLFGVTIVPAVDSYRYVERSIKYGVLFIALVFAAFFLFEVRALARVHPVQYTLVGAALCLFYLALLSLSEVISFESAYWIGAGASTLLVAGYSASVLGAAARAVLVAGGLFAIYGYMYIVLRQQDYALIYGTAA